MKKPVPEDSLPRTPRLGEVRHDERGQAVWHWAVDTARHAIHSTSQLLRKLDLSELSLEEDKPAADPAPDAQLPQTGVRKPAASRAFNPYVSTGPESPARPASRVKPAALAHRAASARRPVSAAPRPSWWRRLLGLG
jgi:hypothetical protein